MTINYDWYIPLIIGMRQSMQHLLLWQLLTRNTLPSVGLKDRFFLNFWDNFIFSDTLGQSIKIGDCPGQSGTVLDNLGRMACMP